MTTLKGVAWRFYVKPVYNGALSSLHYQRREFDPSEQPLGARVHEPDTILYSEGYEYDEDCKIDHNVNALGDSNDDWSKVLAEIVQNAADTTLEHEGYRMIGGWGDGLKVSVARCLKEGCVFTIIVMPTSASVQTVLSTPTPATFIAQNVAPKAFSDVAMYVGHTGKTAHRPDVDSRRQVACLADEKKFRTGVPLNCFDASSGGEELMCTTAILCTEGTCCPPTSLRNAWYAFSVQDAKMHADSIKAKHRSYRVLDLYTVCMDVTVLETDSPGVVEYHVYQNFLFVYKNEPHVLHLASQCPPRGLRVIVHVTAQVSLVSGRDRRLQWHTLASLLQQSSAPASKGLVDFFAETLFSRDAALLMCGLEARNSGESLIFMLNVLVDKFSGELRDCAWPRQTIPVNTAQHMAIATMLTQVRLNSVAYSTLWTPSSYQTCFKKSDLYNVAAQTVTVWKEAEKAIAIIAKSTNAVTGSKDVGEILAFRLPLRALDVSRLASFGVFRSQNVTVDQNNGCLAYDGKLLLPMDAELSSVYLKRTLVHLRLIGPDIMDKLWMAMGKNSKRLQELEKKLSASVSSQAKDSKVLADVCDSKRTGRRVVTPHSPLPSRMTIGDDFPFGGDSSECSLDGDYEGQASFNFVEYTWQCYEQQSEGQPLVSVSQKTGGAAGLVCTQADAKFLVDILKRADFKSPSSTVFSTEETRCSFDPQQRALVRLVLPNTLKHMNANLAKFGAMEGDLGDVPIRTRVHAAVWAVGSAGYMKKHRGGVDRPLLPLNCFSASIRFALLLHLFGYKTSIMVNQVHAFVAIFHLLPGESVTYVECTCSPATLNSVIDKRQIEFMRDHIKLRQPSLKRQRGDTVRVDCFCSYPSSLSAQFYPEDVRTAQCTMCERVFHVMCANDRVEPDGTRVCLVCKPDEKGCFCQKLHHFSPWVETPFHCWISCDDCGRMMHEQCCVDKGISAKSKRHVCSMMNAQCIACDDA
tara:strand:- start:4661 stop:7588 length:2928 start_codon:yes stop_codon:yes gene_type:complete